MTVSKVVTYGCNPLLMLHKLAEAGGVEILSDSKHVRGGYDYHYRTIAKFSDNLYLEAYDPLAELLNQDGRKFVYGLFGSGDLSSSSGTFPVPLYGAKDMPYGQELLLSSWDTPRFAGPSGAERGTAFGIITPDISDSLILEQEILNIPFFALSFCMTYQCLIASYSTPLGGGTIGSDLWDLSIAGSKFIASNVPGGVAGNRLPTITLYNGASTNFTPSQGTHYLLCHGGVRTMSFKAPLMANKNKTIKTYITTPMYGLGGFAMGQFESLAYPMMSGAMVRVSSEINVGGSLKTPTSWVGFPIHSEATVFPSGLLFSNPTDESVAGYSSHLFIGEIDTSKGNNFEKSVVMARMNKETLRSTSGDKDAYLLAQGLLSPMSGEKEFSTFSPTPPIGSDSITGGPVVGNVFVTASDEIRGVLPPFLSCSSSLAIGTMGWLDGRRYRVFRPGLMMQVG